MPILPIAVQGLKGTAAAGGSCRGCESTLGGNSGTNAMQVYPPTMRYE